MPIFMFLLASSAAKQSQKHGMHDGGAFVDASQLARVLQTCHITSNASPRDAAEIVLQSAHDFYVQGVRSVHDVSTR